jgi:hypothetical protein
VDNDILKHFQYGNITNDWDTLLRKTSYMFQWRAKVLNRKGMGVSGQGCYASHQ